MIGDFNFVTQGPEGHVVDNKLWGTINDIDVKLFDFQYAFEKSGTLLFENQTAISVIPKCAQQCATRLKV